MLIVFSSNYLIICIGLRHGKDDSHLHDGFRTTLRVPHMDQEIPSIVEHLSSSPQSPPFSPTIIEVFRDAYFYFSVFVCFDN
jgi:hypothetical protein